MRHDPMMVLMTVLEVTAEEVDIWMKKGHSELKVGLLLLAMILIIGFFGND